MPRTTKAANAASTHTQYEPWDTTTHANIATDRSCAARVYALHEREVRDGRTVAMSSVSGRLRYDKQDFAAVSLTLKSLFYKRDGSREEHVELKLKTKKTGLSELALFAECLLSLVREVQAQGANDAAFNEHGDDRLVTLDPFAIPQPIKGFDDDDETESAAPLTAA